MKFLSFHFIKTQSFQDFIKWFGETFVDGGHAWTFHFNHKLVPPYELGSFVIESAFLVNVDFEKYAIEIFSGSISLVRKLEFSLDGAQ